MIKRHDYFAFGEDSAAPTGDSRRFTGKERDAETELHYFGARYYRSTLGRFATVDPVMNVDEAIGNPQQWNRYSSALNNPLRFVDPDGRQVQLVQWLLKYEPAIAKTVQGIMSAKGIPDAGKALLDIFGGGVNGKIDAALTSGNLHDQMVGIVANLAQATFGAGSVEDINHVVRGPDGTRQTDIDVKLSFANVEIKTGESGNWFNAEQIKSQVALGRPVVIYAPVATNNQIREAESLGAKVVKSSDELFKTLSALRK